MQVRTWKVLVGTGVVWAALPLTAEIPRTDDGKPDFSGTYDISSLTRMDRDPELGERMTYTVEEVEELKRVAHSRVDEAAAPSDPTARASKRLKARRGSAASTIREPIRRAATTGSGSTAAASTATTTRLTANTARRSSSTRTTAVGRRSPRPAKPGARRSGRTTRPSIRAKPGGSPKAATRTTTRRTCPSATAASTCRWPSRPRRLRTTT